MQRKLILLEGVFLISKDSHGNIDKGYHHHIFIHSFQYPTFTTSRHNTYYKVHCHRMYVRIMDNVFQFTYQFSIETAKI